MPESAFPDRIGIGDNEIPCKVVSFDLARDDAPPVVAQQDPEGTMRIVEWEASPAPGPTIEVEQARFTAERAGQYVFGFLRPSSHYLVDTSAPPNSCRQCGEFERGHGEDHAYVVPDNVLRLARMKARRQARLNPPRRIRLTPEMMVSFRINMGAYITAMSRALEALNDVTRPVISQTRTLADAPSQDDEDDDDWGEPLEESDANWPAQGRVCAHVCGGDADHRCDARATEQLTYTLPSGGTRTMPICGPCHASETAAKETANA